MWSDFKKIMLFDEGNHNAEVDEHLWITAALHDCSCTLHLQISNVTFFACKLMSQPQQTVQGSLFCQSGIAELLLLEFSP